MVLLVSPVIVYTVAFDQHFLSVKPSDCDVSEYRNTFPASTAAYYSSRGLNMSDSREWYLDEWKVFMNRKGVCPTSTGTNFVGEKVATNCIRPSLSSALDVFVKVDDLNKDDYSIQSNMQKSYEDLKAISTCSILGIVVGGGVVALSVCIISTSECHTGGVVVFGAFLCLCPGIFSLSYLLQSDMSSGTNWRSFFPSCETIAVEYLATPGMALLFFQVGLLTLIELTLLVSSVYISFCKERTNDEEDGVDVDFDELFLHRDVPLKAAHSTRKHAEREYFACGLGHRCRISFGLPLVYQEAGAMNGEITCKLCHRPHIDLKEMYAYFVYCEQCFLGRGLDTDNDFSGAYTYLRRSKSRHEIMPDADRHFDVCQICANEWRISGSKVLREPDIFYEKSERQKTSSVTSAADVHAII